MSVDFFSPSRGVALTLTAKPTWSPIFLYRVTIKLVTAHTHGFASIPVIAFVIATGDVLSVRDCFKVRWVDAAPGTALMVYLCPIRDRTNELLVRCPMRQGLSVTTPKLCVPVIRKATKPQPTTTVWFFEGKSLKTFGDWCFGRYFYVSTMRMPGYIASTRAIFNLYTYMSLYPLVSSMITDFLRWQT